MTTAERLLAGIKESASRASIARPFEIDMREPQVAEAITYLFSLQCAQTGKVADITPMVVKAIEKAAHWLVNPERVSLKILGTPGTGKTTLLYAIREFIWRYNQTQPFGRVGLRIHPALMIVDAFQRKDANLDLNMAVSIPVLAIDDVGVEATEIKYYGSELRPVTDIILHRSNENKPTIIVSNFGEPDFLAKYGERVFDRLKDMTTILMTGESNRRNK